MHNIDKLNEEMIIATITTFICFLTIVVFADLLLFIAYIITKNEKINLKKNLLLISIVGIVCTLIISSPAIIDVATSSYLEVDNVVSFEKCYNSTKQVFADSEYKITSQTGQIYYGYDFLLNDNFLSEITYPCDIIIAKNSRYILLIE